MSVGATSTPATIGPRISLAEIPVARSAFAGWSSSSGTTSGSRPVDAGLKKLDGKSDDKTALMAAMKSLSIEDTPRGAIKFDHLGNVVGDIIA